MFFPIMAYYRVLSMDPCAESSTHYLFFIFSSKDLLILYYNSIPPAHPPDMFLDLIDLTNSSECLLGAQL